MELEKITDRYDEVYNLETLDKTFKKISHKKQEVKTNADYVKSEIEKLNKWLEEVNKPLESDISYYESLITHYHKRVLEINPKKKTLSSPNGKCKSRTTSATPVLKVEESVLEHLKNNGMNELIQTTEVIDWANLKGKINVKEYDNGEVRFYDENGLEIKGLELKSADTKFTTEVKE